MVCLPKLAEAVCLHPSRDSDLQLLPLHVMRVRRSLPAGTGCSFFAVCDTLSEFRMKVCRIELGCTNSEEGYRSIHRPVGISMCVLPVDVHLALRCAVV